MNHAHRLLHYVRQSAIDAPEAVTDGHLLQRFLDRRDEAAFASLLSRHGAMVWSLCRRVLGNDHDAEDAFQATFLVLARKAESVLPRDRVGNWLYGVAHNAARKLRDGRERRRKQEARAARIPPRDNPNELSEVLDAELSRLPDAYRAAVIACDLEGKTRAEAARDLGWPEGTVAGRLARARELLARRLRRHGLPDGAASGVLVVAPPMALTQTTGRLALTMAEASPQVLSLMEGVLRTMLMTKVKAVSAGLALVLAIGFTMGTVAATRPDETGEGENPRAAAEKNPTAQKPHGGPKPPSAEEELARLVGSWELTSGSVTESGDPNLSVGYRTREFTPAERRSYFLHIDKEATVTFSKGGVGGKLTFVAALDPSPWPRQILLYPLGADEDKCLRGVYRLDGDVFELSIHDRLNTGQPPKEVGKVTRNPGRYLTLKRVKRTVEPAKKAEAPAGPGAGYKERLAGTWRVDEGTRASAPLTGWDRLGVLFSFGADGKLWIRGGAVEGRTEFACKLDLESKPATLTLSNAEGRPGTPLKLSCQFLENGQVVLSCPRTQNSAAWSYTLARHKARRPTTATVLGLRVSPSGSPLSRRLLGTWRPDAGLTKRLTGIEQPANASRHSLTFQADPTVAPKIPEAYRDLLAGKKVFLSGHMTTTIDGKRSTPQPFVLIEHEGGPVLVSFEQDEEGSWVDEQAMAVSVVPGMDRDGDLLFLSEAGPSGKDQPASAFKRSLAN